MEFKEVIGRRRSIRYFAPYRPVEREKIQTILEAARLASCAVNDTFLRAIVVQRDDLAPEVLESLKTPVSALNLALAPVHIYFYGDLHTLRESRGNTLKELIDVGATTWGCPSTAWKAIRRWSACRLRMRPNGTRSSAWRIVRIPCLNSSRPWQRKAR